MSGELRTPEHPFCALATHPLIPCVFPEKEGSATKRLFRSVVWIVVAFFACASVIVTCGAAATAADLLIFGDNLATGWDNWSWNTTTSISAISASAPVHGGAHSLAVTYSGAWAGLYLHVDSSIDLPSYESLRFWIHGGGAGNQALRVVANGDGNNAFPVIAQANVWTQITVPLSALGGPSSLEGLYWQDTSGGVQPTFYLDDIVLIAVAGPPPPPPSPEAGPALSIDARAARHAISEDIYGMNFATEELATALRLPVRRWGGNSTSRYNWQNDTHNAGSDWYFENIPDQNSNPAALPDGSTVDRFVEQDWRTGTKTLLTAPLIGWAPKRRLTNHPYDCGFKVSVYGQQQSVDPWDTDCGNGVLAGGGTLTGNDPHDTSVEIGPPFVADWIAHLSAKYGSAAQGGVAYYNLDNEPMLWNSTHRDLHPHPVTYDEIRDLTYGYAAAIKAVDPSVKTLGPVLWGWCAYFYSARDGCSVGQDFQTHGNLYFVPWYLQQVRAYEQQHGVRLLDYLDLHHYPQASGVALSSAGNAATQALRLRSTRSLWDASYLDESWISDTAPGGVAVRLIPRMKEWVAANYPGTKLAITEYNWGALDHINGALTQADLLGIFGREGLDLATLWGPPSIDDPGAFAFRIYRNYDDTRKGFGDVSVQATSADQEQMSVYAAQRSTDDALTVVVINKTANSLTSDVSLAGFAPTPAAAAYRYSAAIPNAIVRLPDQSVTESGFSATFPASSITLFLMMPGTVPNVILSITRTGTGAGTVTSNPAGINCGADCTEAYPDGTPVTLTATADAGALFLGWSGEGCSGTGTCVVTMTQARTVAAPFLAPPGAAPLTSPTGTIGTNTPPYTWTAVPTATWYYLWVVDATGTKVQTWYAAASVGCAAGGTCSVTPSTLLAPGPATWWVQTWNSAGYGPWSSGLGFTVPALGVPPAVSGLLAPTGTIGTSTPTYTWTAVPTATWYYLWVNDSTGTRIQQWYPASALSCASGTCRITPAPALALGAATWWVQSWNPAGYGSWSAGQGFTVGP